MSNLINRFSMLVFTNLLLILPSLEAKPRSPKPLQRQENYSLTKGEAVPIAAKKATLPFMVYGEEPVQSTHFVAAGYMGDTQALSVLSAQESAPLPSGSPGRVCLKVRCRPKGAEGWAGVYWLTSPTNWAKVKGGGYDLSQAQRLTFWVRGQKGGEKVSEFKVGGLVGPYPDTDVATIGPITLSKNWEQYAIDLRGKDLRHICGGFSFSMRRADNFEGALFYLDEIRFEDKAADPSVSQSSAPALSTTTISADASAASVQPSTPAFQEPIFETVQKTIPFPTATAILSYEPRKDLEDIVELASKNTRTVVLVEGHTDNIGPLEVNKRLSMERAKFVADYLVSQGLDRSRIVINGYGPEKPISPDSNKTLEGRKKNRRVEVTLAPVKQ